MAHSTKPKIAVINSLARTGGTLINRCIGSMEGNIVFSETHPVIYRGVLLSQAQDWFDLATKESFDEKADGSTEFFRILKTISAECADRELSLVIRNWNHIDFIAQPFLPYPIYRNTVIDQIADDYDVKEIAIIRHPIDQWLSLNSLSLYSDETLRIGYFLEGYLKFLKCCGQKNHLKYEDLIDDPDRHFKKMCSALEINYDPGYRNKWFDYEFVTGDIHKGGRGYGKKEIVRMARKPISKELFNRFLVQPQYHEILRLTGYDIK